MSVLFEEDLTINSMDDNDLHKCNVGGVNMFKGRAIKKYFLELRPNLRSRYGKEKYYTKEQVISTIKACGFKQKYAIYALAIYLHRDEFESLTDDFSTEEIRGARQEVADRFFGGNKEFVYIDVDRFWLSSQVDGYVKTTSNFFGFGDSGGHSGGDSGGGGVD